MTDMAAPTPRQGGKAAHGSLLRRVMSAASAASHTAAAIMPGPTHATGTRPGNPGLRKSSGTAAVGAGGMGLGALQQAASAGLGQLMTRAGMPPPAAATHVASGNGNTNRKATAEGLVRNAMAEGGGDTTDDEAVTMPLAGGAQGMSPMIVPSVGPQGQVAGGTGRSGSPGGLVGAAAAALSQVAKAASGAADGRAGPLAVQAAQAAMASAPKVRPDAALRVQHVTAPAAVWGLIADELRAVAPVTPGLLPFPAGPAAALRRPLLPLAGGGRPPGPRALLRGGAAARRRRDRPWADSRPDHL